jgi:hypothetical protein
VIEDSLIHMTFKLSVTGIKGRTGEKFLAIQAAKSLNPGPVTFSAKLPELNNADPGFGPKVT